MAEARSAVTGAITVPSFELSVSGEGLLLRIDKNAFRSLLRQSKRSFRRKLRELRNWLINFVYPANPAHWALTVGGIAAVMLIDNHRTEKVASLLWKAESKIPWISRLTKIQQASLFAVATGTGVVFGQAVTRKFLLRGLLSYKGWLYEQPGKQNLFVAVWAGFVRILSGRHPLLYSNQQTLPRLPVPSLRATISKYLTTVRPLLSDEEFARVSKKGEDFLRNEGPKLQRYLVLKSWIAPNYVTDWWEKYCYLMGRSPIMINSNYYVIDSDKFVPTTVQVARAANLITQMLKFKKMLDREKLEPMFIRNTVPMCMNQYRRMFSTTRLPGHELDTIEHYSEDESQHIVVLRNGAFYRLDCFRPDGTALTTLEFESQLKWIVDDADRAGATVAEASLPALTAENRTTWAEARLSYFSAGVNRDSLTAIDTAVFVVSLDNEASGDLTEMGRKLIHGDGRNRWFDKSFTFVVFSNGKCGLNVEHSWADAPVMGHMFEWSMCMEVRTGYAKNGYNKRPATPVATVALPVPRRLRWEFSGEAEETIRQAYENAKKLINDFDLRILAHYQYGKGFVKKCRVSPDAWVQMALQLAYRRDAKKFALTYESSMTRLFRDGRTETVRPVSVDSVAFINSMIEDKLPKKERIRLLQIAAETHQSYYRDAMSGKGVDRHLFGLYIVSKGTGVDSEFLKEALSQPWRLSTSQQPQQQTNLWNLNDPKDLERVSPGGGFGPVADDGYGCSYMIVGEDRFYFHVSSLKSCPDTDSSRFAQQIELALKDMRELFSQ